MTTSENQVRQLYVVNAAADFSAVKDKEGALRFGMKDIDGKAVASDLITHILDARATSATAGRVKPRTIKITATDADMVAGQDYLLHIGYRAFISQSDEDTHIEVGSAHCYTTGDDVEKVLLELAKNLALNTKTQGLVEVKVTVSGTEKAISALSSSDVVDGIIIRELPQAWRLGLIQVSTVDFTVSAPYITKNLDEVPWATITDITASQTATGNGKKVADLEYFLLGERGDIYRGMGYPNVLPCPNMVDPSKEYDFIDIHYAYIGANHAVQMSEKTITLVMPVDASGATAEDKHAVANAALAAINTAAGSTLLTAAADWTTPASV